MTITFPTVATSRSPQASTSRVYVEVRRGRQEAARPGAGGGGGQAFWRGHTLGRSEAEAWTGVPREQGRRRPGLCTGDARWGGSRAAATRWAGEARASPGSRGAGGRPEARASPGGGGRGAVGGRLGTRPRRPRRVARGRARRRPSPPPAATMSTGLRYKSKLATPGEPGARPRARAPLSPPPARRPLTVSFLSPSPAGPDADPDPTPTLQRTSRYVRAAAPLPGLLSPIVAPTLPAPRRDPAPAGSQSFPVAITDNRLSAGAVPSRLGLQGGAVGARMLGAWPLTLTARTPLPGRGDGPGVPFPLIQRQHILPDLALGLVLGVLRAQTGQAKGWGRGLCPPAST